MKLLREILYKLDVDTIIGNTNIAISSIHFNSEEVIESALFVAIKGLNNDGHNFISKAISTGSIAIICEDLPKQTADNVTYIQVKNSAISLALVASNFFNNPSNNIQLIGITGTNGKTSTAYYLFSIFKQLNFKVGLISTIENKINNKSYPTIYTTPNPIELNRLLSKMVDNECEFCFMEISSHGILQNRTHGLNFNIAVFTNISRDHLDYHNSFNNYITTKKHLIRINLRTRKNSCYMQRTGNGA